MTEPKKVLPALFIESAGIGGAEKVVLDLYRLYSARGIKLPVLMKRTGWLSHSLEHAGAEIHFIEGDSSIGFIRHLLKVLKSLDVNILHSHSLDSNFYGAIAARLCGKAHLATEHGDVHHTTERSGLARKLKIMKWLGTEFNSVAKFSADKLNEFGVPENLVSTIPNPIDIGVKFLDEEERQKLRYKYGADENSHIWVHVANFRPVKDQATLIRGFAEAVSMEGETKTHQRLWLIGDGDLRKSLEDLARELKVQDRIEFLGFREEVNKYLSASDGFVLSSLSEAMPMSLLEAGAYGLPAICSRVGGIPGILADSDNPQVEGSSSERRGFMFEAGNSERLGKLLYKVSSDRDESILLGQRLKEHIHAEFSGDKVADAYLERYEEILAR